MAVQTATNPKTGERVALINGRWVPYTQSATNPKTGAKAFLVNGQWLTAGVSVPAPAPPKEESGFFRQLADVPVQVAGGVASGIRLITDAFGADNPVSQTIRGAETYLQGLLSAQAKEDQQEVARIMKEAEDKGVLDQVIAGLKAFSVAPIDTIAQAAGTTAPVIVGGLAAAALRAPAVVGLLGTGATMGAGTIKSSIYDATYEVLREQGVSDDVAKKKAAEAQAYNGENLDQIVLGAGLGAAAGRFGVEPIAAKQIAGEISKRAIAKTAAAEAGTEFAQASQEQIAENIALRRQGYDVPLFRGAVSAGTLEAVAGAGLGAGAEFARPGEKPVEAVPPPPPPAATTTTEVVPPPPAEPKPFTVDDLINAPPKVAAEDAPESMRYEPTTLSEEAVGLEIDKMEDEQDQLADLLLDEEQLAQGAARARIPVELYKANITEDFDRLATRLDIFNKHLDGTLSPVKPTITQDQVSAAGVSPDVAKALNVQSTATPTAATAQGVPDATAAAAPPITPPPDVGATARGVALPPSGLAPAGSVPAEPTGQGLESATRVAGDVVRGEEGVQRPLEFKQRGPTRDIDAEIAALDRAEQERNAIRDEVKRFARASAENAIASQNNYSDLQDSIDSNRENIRDTLNEGVFGKDAVDFESEAFAAYDDEIEKLKQKSRGFKQRGVSEPVADTNNQGRPVYPTEEGRQNFKNWFGESKAKDSEQRPVVYYHASAEPGIQTFRRGRAEAIFAAPEPATAQYFLPPTGEGTVYPVYIRAENPFDYQNPQHVEALINAYDAAPAQIKNFDRNDLKSLIERGAWQVIEQRPIQRLIKNLGHDGFYISELGTKNLAVYDAGQIKSAVGNVGDFSRRSRKILEQRKPAAEPKKEAAFDESVLYSTPMYEVDPLPDGPFTNARDNVVAADNVDPRFQKLLSRLMKSLGLGDVRVFLATKSDLLPPGATFSEALFAARNRYGLSADYAINPVLSEIRKKGTQGYVRQFGTGNKDFILVYDEKRTLNQNIEAIAHELGHIIQTVAYNEASTEVRREIQKEYEEWLKSVKGKDGRTIIQATRNRETAFDPDVLRMAPGQMLNKDDLEYYTSFSEWFADNVSKWVTTDQKPMTVVQKFFADIARRIRRLVGELTRNKFVPNKAVANFLNKMGPVDATAWLRATEVPNIGGASMMNSVGNTVNNLPKLSRGVYESVRNILNSDAIADNLRSGIYAFLSLPQQVQLFVKELPSLRQLLNVLNVRASALKDRKEVLDRNIRKWTRIIKKFNEATRAKFYELAHESTRLQIDFKNPTQQDLSDPERARIVREFNALDESLKTVYYDMLASYRSMSDEYLKLLSKNLSPRAAKRLAREMARKRLKIYLPLFREGNYWLRYQDANNDTVVRSFNSNRERQFAIQEAVQNGAAQSSMQSFSRPEQAFEKTQVGPFFNKIMDELDQRGASAATKRALYEMYLDQIPAQSVRQQYRARARQDGSVGYKGYETDLINVYATVASRMANQLINLEYIPEIDKVYADIIEESKQAGAQAQNLAVDKLMANLKLQMDYLRDPGNSPLVNGLSSFSYYWYIIGNISTAVINLTQLPMVVYPVLASKYGMAETTSAMQDAVAQYYKGGWDNDDVPGGEKKFPSDKSFGIGLPPNSPLKKLFDAAVRQSAIRRSSGYDVVEGRKKNYGIGDYVGLKAKTEQILGWVFQNSERFNREITLIAAFNLEMKKNGGDINRSIEAAIDAVNMTHGVTLTETSPRVFQTGFGKVAFTFKNFAQTMVYLQASLLNDAVRGESPEVKKLAAKQLLGISGMAFIFAGVQGMPFYGAGITLANIFNAMFGDDDDPFMPKDELRNSMDALPYKGVVNQLLMADVAARTGFGNLLWRDDEKRVEEIGPVLFAMEQIFGPSYAAGMGIYRGFEDWSDGHTYRAVESFTPSFIRNNLKAYRFLTEGALTRDKEVIYDDFSKYELFMQTLGFTPIKLGSRSEAAGAVARAQKNLENRKSALLDRLYLAKVNKDKEGYREALEAIKKYNKNENVKKLGAQIKDIGRSMEERRRRAAQSTYGTYTPKKMQKGVRELIVKEEEKR